MFSKQIAKFKNKNGLLGATKLLYYNAPMLLNTVSKIKIITCTVLDKENSTIWHLYLLFD